MNRLVKSLSGGRWTWIAGSMLCIFAMTCNAASASFQTGNELLEECETPVGTAKWIQCLGYIEGSVDSYELRPNPPNGTDKNVCVAAGVTARQAMDIVTEYLHKYPEKRHWSADILVWNALITKFPCQ
jgi:hypothetical protein